MRNQLNSIKLYVFAGFGIIFIATFLRVFNLNELPVFGDEAIYIRWAQIMRNEPTLRFLPLSDGKQPLFMWVVILFQKFASDPLIAGRLVSMVTGIMTMVGIYFLTVLLFGKGSEKDKNLIGFLIRLFRDKKLIKAGLIASFIYAISPYTVFFDRMALVDSMLTMFGVWTFIFSLIAFRFVRLDSALLAGFSLGGAYLTKSPALFFLLALPSNWLNSYWPKTDRKKLTHFLMLSGLTVVIVVLALGIFNLLRLGPNFHLLAKRNLDYVHPISRLLEYPTDPLFVFLRKILGYFWNLGPSAMILMFIASFVFNIKKYKKSILVLSVWSILPIIAVSEFSQTMTARYILFTIPFLIILSASGYLVKEKKKYYLMTVILLIFTIHSLLVNRLILTDIEAAPLPQGDRSGYLEEWTSGTGIREVSEYLIQYKNENDRENIVVGTEGFFGTLPDGLQAYLYNHPDILVIGIGTRIRDLPKELYESKKAGNHTFLVINNSRLITSYERLGLQLINQYPKAFRAEWTSEYKSMGPQEVLYIFEVTDRSVNIYEEAHQNEKN